MDLQKKIVITSLIAYLLLVAGLFVLTFFSLSNTKQDILTQLPDTIEKNEFFKLEHEIVDEAQALDGTLNHYYNDVFMLQDRYQDRLQNKDLLASIVDANLYPDKDSLGLPKYGYVHQIYGAYADYDLKSEASPWLPKRVVDSANKDLEFKKNISEDLDLMVSMTPLFSSVYKKNQSEEMLDLVWIVLENGATNVYPPYDYLSIISENPAIIDLNESEKKYVSLLNPKNNPTKEILWLKPYFDEYRLTWMTSVVAPLYKGEEFLGTLGEDILLGTITEKIFDFPINEFGSPFLIDEDNHLIAMSQVAIGDLIQDPNAKLALEELLKPNADQNWNSVLLTSLEQPLEEIVKQDFFAVIKNLRMQESGVTKVETSDGVKVVAYASLPKTEWVLVSILPYDNVIQLSKDYDVITSQLIDDIVGHFWVILFFGLLFILIVYLLGYFSLIKPIVILTDWVKKVKENTGSFQMKDWPLTKRKDEIGLLSDAFRVTTNELKEASEIISRSKEELESRVKERTADLLEANEKLKELDIMKDEFLNTATHELKTPLISIKAQLQLLLNGDFGKLDSEQKKSLEMVLRNEERLNKLVTDVLDISRIESRKLSLALEKVSLGNVIKEAVADFVSTAKENQIDISFKAEAMPPILIDSRRITQVIGNLLNNAIKFTSASGKIKVELSKSGNNALIKITDTGIGISEKNMKKIFVPFFQAETGLVKKFGGTGLGLSICKGVVEAHNGEIWVESVGEGHGATFSFTLPL